MKAHRHSKKNWNIDAIINRLDGLPVSSKYCVRLLVHDEFIIGESSCGWFESLSNLDRAMSQTFKDSYQLVLPLVLAERSLLNLLISQSRRSLCSSIFRSIFSRCDFESLQRLIGGNGSGLGGGRIQWMRRSSAACFTNSLNPIGANIEHNKIIK